MKAERPVRICKLAMLTVTCVATAVAFSGFVGNFVFAADSWLNGVQDKPQADEVLIRSLGAQRGCGNGLTCFDVTICLTGDGHSPSIDARDDYEEVVEAWADAVYEQSNGKHVLGNVRIFPSPCGVSASSADVRWQNTLDTPFTQGVSGFGQSGDYFIRFTNNSEDLNNNPIDFLSSPTLRRIGGYVLGHEWAHYVYGLYDEYAAGGSVDCPDDPHSGDTNVDSFMGRFNTRINSSFVSLLDLKWLNHSTLDNYATNTAQNRMLTASGWEVLSRAMTDDPVAPSSTCHLRFNRMQYTDLDLVKPTVNGQIRGVDRTLSFSDLSNPSRASLDQLNIIWKSNVLIVQIVIDKSSSMNIPPIQTQPPPIANARQAALNLVEALFTEQSVSTKYVGVIAFNDEVDCYTTISNPLDPAGSCREVIVPVQELTDANKLTIEAQIQSITASGLTALFDAAGSAERQINNFITLNPSDDERIPLVFFLSDGLDISSTLTQQDVVNRYTGATPPVPLNTFAYGLGINNPDLLALLRDLARDTGGVSFQSPVDQDEITRAFLTVLAKQTSGVSLARDGVAAPPFGSTVLQEIEIDSTLESFVIFAIYEGQSTDLTFTLEGPSGEEIPNVTFECDTVSETTSCSALVDIAVVNEQGFGTYLLRALNNVATEIVVEIDVLGTPAPVSTYELTVASQNGDTITFPTSMILTASVNRGISITGVNLAATITDPEDTVFPLALNDSGVDGDQLAGDGIYTTTYDYQMDGAYTVNVQIDNADLSAEFTIVGALVTPGFAIVPSPPITENFTRTASIQTIVKGMADAGGDDHPDSAPGTPIPADNTRIAGSINAESDVDFFTINNVDTSRDLIVRVTDLGLGMDPLLKVYDPTGTVEIASGDMATAVGESGYVFIRIPAADLDPAGTMTASVQHVDVNAMSGNYNISAGNALGFEAIDVPIYVKPKIINTKWKRKIKVIILSQPGFQPVTDVDQSTLRFGKTGFEDSLVFCKRAWIWGRGLDFNRDGVPELICLFKQSKTGFERGDTQAVLRGETNSEEEFRGVSRIWVLKPFRNWHADQSFHHGYRTGFFRELFHTGRRSEFDDEAED